MSFEVTNDNKLTIYIDGDIGGWWGLNKQEFRWYLQRYGKGKDIDLLISSPGGDADDALNIYDLLSTCEGNTTAYLSGFVASAATIVACGCKKIIMSEQCIYMYHRANGRARGDRDEMRKAANTLEKVDNIISNIYQKRTGMTDEQLQERMKQETYLSSAEAISDKFVDEVVPNFSGMQVMNKANLSSIENKYGKIPTNLMPESINNIENKNFFEKMEEKFNKLFKNLQEKFNITPKNQQDDKGDIGAQLEEIVKNTLGDTDNPLTIEDAITNSGKDRSLIIAEIAEEADCRISEVKNALEGKGGNDDILTAISNVLSIEKSVIPKPQNSGESSSLSADDIAKIIEQKFKEQNQSIQNKLDEAIQKAGGGSITNGGDGDWGNGEESAELDGLSHLGKAGAKAMGITNKKKKGGK